MSIGPEGRGSDMDYFAGPRTAPTPPLNRSTEGRLPRGPLGWMMARRRNVLIVYGFAAILTLAAMIWSPRLPEHTYLQVPQQVIGLQGAGDEAFYGVEQDLHAASGGKQLAAQYDNSDGQPRAYFYAEDSSRSAAAIASARQGLQSVLLRDLAAAPFQPVASGGLGGQMDCATATIFSQHAMECAFADTHVSGVVLLLEDSASHANVIKVRQAVEQRTTTEPPGTHSSRTGLLVGGGVMALFALLAGLYGPRYLQFINDHPELQLIPMGPYRNLAPTKIIIRAMAIVLCIAGVAFFISAL